MLNQETSYFIRNSAPEDLQTIKSLLEELNLPFEDIQSQFDNFIILQANEKVIGCAGFEVYGQYGLLRSVAIRKEYQKMLLGSKLVMTVENKAHEKNLQELYLLTETADKFFLKHNYIIVPRSKVPIEIQKSYEYAHVCKESGIVLKKILGKI